MRFQRRDGEILQAIYDNDGVLGKRHLKKLFWFEKTSRAMERRLALLRKDYYIEWPTRENYRMNPIPEPICWLGWKGIQYIAGKSGIRVNPPIRFNENRLRTYQNRLRNYGIRWVREPRWSILRHDLAIIDFRLAIEKSVDNFPSLIVENWIPESVFRADPDVVRYKTKDRNGNVVYRKKGICPDAYFEIIDEERRKMGMPEKARFLLELDMSNHDNPSFGREKVLPGIAYITSQVFKSRFGNNSGLWLVVTNGGDKRLRNLLHQVDEKDRSIAQLFFFTSFQNLSGINVLTAPIWRQVGSEEQKPLIEINQN